MRGPRIAFVTSRRRREPTPDDALAATALERRGTAVVGVPWDEADADWRGFDLVVLRSCWDYHERFGEFREWLTRLEPAGARVWNPPSLVAWNADKRYLAALEARGVPVVATEFVEGKASLAEILARRGWGDVVVKPAVSASAWRTWRTSAAEAHAAQRHLDEVLSGGAALVQPFVAEVEREGEWSLVFLGGAFSHALLKSPAAGDFRVQEELGGQARLLEPPEGLVAAAEATLAGLGPTLYARVDGVRRGAGFALMELELIEPCLYFAADPRAAERMAEAVFARL